MDFNNNITTKKPEETARVGEELAHHLMNRGGAILCLYGELGAGKTTFTQGFARGLGITTRLLSPTFIIVRRYQIPQKDFFLNHVDLYRLQTVPEMEGVGLPEIFADLASFTVVEWAERLGELTPGNHIDVYFTAAQDGTHDIVIKGLV